MTYRYTGDGSNLGAIIVIVVIVLAAMLLMNNRDRSGTHHNPVRSVPPDYGPDRYLP